MEYDVSNEYETQTGSSYYIIEVWFYDLGNGWYLEVN